MRDREHKPAREGGLFVSGIKISRPRRNIECCMTAASMLMLQAITNPGDAEHGSRSHASNEGAVQL